MTHRYILDLPNETTGYEYCQMSMVTIIVVFAIIVSMLIVYMHSIVFLIHVVLPAWWKRMMMTAVLQLQYNVM